MLSRLFNHLFRKGPKRFHTLNGPLNHARNLIRSVNLEAPDKCDINLVLMPGKKIRNGGEDDWMFNLDGVRTLGMAEYTRKLVTITVGSPVKEPVTFTYKTSKRVWSVLLARFGGVLFNAGTLLHELAHALRMQVGDFGHHPKLRGLFAGWSDTGRRKVPEIGEGMTYVHIDRADGTEVCMVRDQQGYEEYIIT